MSDYIRNNTKKNDKICAISRALNIIFCKILDKCVQFYFIISLIKYIVRGVVMDRFHTAQRGGCSCPS